MYKFTCARLPNKEGTRATRYDKESIYKCAIAERTNRTLKVTLVCIADHNNGRYIDDLDNVVRGYNETQHSAIGFAPNDATPINIDTVRQQLYKRAAKRRAQQFGKKTWDSGTDVASAKSQVGEWAHLQVYYRSILSTTSVYQSTRSHCKEDKISLYQDQQILRPNLDTRGNITKTTECRGEANTYNI